MNFPNADEKVFYCCKIKGSETQNNIYFYFNRLSVYNEQ